MQLFRYLFSFALARGVMFLSPIWLGNILASAEYGRLELMQAMASVMAPLMALGTGGLIPLILIRSTQGLSLKIIFVHHLLCAAGALIIGGLIHFSWRDDLAIWVCVAAAAILLQGLWSIVLKSRSQPDAGLLLDAGFWVAMAVGAGIAYLAGMGTSLAWNAALMALTVYLLALLLSTWSGARKLDGIWMSRDHLHALKNGLPLMVAALLSTLATSSGRLGIGVLSTAEMTADYSMLFRCTAIPIVAHQVIVVALYRNIFQVSHAELQRKLMGITVMVFSATLIFWFVDHWAVLVFGSSFRLAWSRFHTEALLILMQCVLWSAIALNDMVNNRYQSAGRASKAGGVYFLLALGLAYLLLNGRQLTMALYIFAHSLLMLGYFIVQCLAMWRSGVFLTRWWVSVLGMYISSVVAVLII